MRLGIRLVGFGRSGRVENEPFGRVDPPAAGVQAAIGAHGAENRSPCNWRRFRSLYDGIEGGGEILSPLIQETRRRGMTVEETSRTPSLKMERSAVFTDTS